MRKIQYLILFLLLGACAAKNAGEQRFVNPLFYETLHPISRIAWETHLTPTKKTIINRGGYTHTDECILIENTQEMISLKCKRYYDPRIYEPHEIKKDASDIYTYTIEQPTTDESVYYNGIRVIQRNITPENWESSRMSFAIEDKK